MFVPARIVVPVPNLLIPELPAMVALMFCVPVVVRVNVPPPLMVRVPPPVISFLTAKPRVASTVSSVAPVPVTLMIDERAMAPFGTKLRTVPPEKLNAPVVRLPAMIPVTELRARTPPLRLYALEAEL